MEDGIVLYCIMLPDAGAHARIMMVSDQRLATTKKRFLSLHFVAISHECPSETTCSNCHPPPSLTVSLEHGLELPTWILPYTVKHPASLVIQRLLGTNLNGASVFYSHAAGTAVCA